VLSSAGLDAAEAETLKRELLIAILDEEESHLSTVASLFPIIRSEIAAGAMGA
jgi:hypothetical protein